MPGLALAQLQRELDERALVAPAVEPHAVALARRSARCSGASAPARTRGRAGSRRAGWRPTRRACRRAARASSRQRLAHLGIVMADHHRVHRHGADVARGCRSHHRVHHVHGALVVGHGDRDAEDLPCGDLGLPARMARGALRMRLYSGHRSGSAATWRRPAGREVCPPRPATVANTRLQRGLRRRRGGDFPV